MRETTFKQTTMDKIGWGFFVLVVIVVLFLVGLFSWGFIELVQWATSQ